MMYSDVLNGVLSFVLFFVLRVVVPMVLILVIGELARRRQLLTIP